MERDLADASGTRPTYAPLIVEAPVSSDEVAEEASDLRRHEDEVASLEKQEEEVHRRLEDLDALWKSRRTPLENQLGQIRRNRDQAVIILESARRNCSPVKMPPGPLALSFVSSDQFNLFTSAVIVANIVAMAWGFYDPDPDHAGVYEVLDSVFLTWYVLELSARALYYRTDFFIGDLSVVWWNWVDLVVVVAGLVYSVLPLIIASMQEHDSLSATGHYGRRWLRLLRGLRLLRILRLASCLKAVRIFAKSDLAWSESAVFECFIMIVIVTNACLMGVELDHPWEGWKWLDSVILIIFCFELFVRMKHRGSAFWTKTGQRGWNILDVLIVTSGVAEAWVGPYLLYANASTPLAEEHGRGLALLQVLRLLRVLRLVRLLKGIKPLYKVMLGVTEALEGMEWVFLLTFILLYASAILFTSLVGCGLIDDDESRGAKETFGSVSKSMLALFKLMNDDQSVVEPIIQTVPGQMLFMSFMVVANWAFLAILTSVVSDNMITASQRVSKEDKDKDFECERLKQRRRLGALFEEVNADSSGFVDEEEFSKLLDDDGLYHEFCGATGLSRPDLEDLFVYLSEVQDGRPVLMYESFISAVQDDGQPADKRSVLHVLHELKSIRTRLELRIEKSLVLQGARAEELNGLKAEEQRMQPHMRRRHTTKSEELASKLRTRTEVLFHGLHSYGKGSPSDDNRLGP